jgi:hypothetical protein
MCSLKKLSQVRGPSYTYWVLGVKWKVIARKENWLISQTCTNFSPFEDFFWENKYSKLSFFHLLFIVGSGNSYSNFLRHFSYYIISIIHPLFCYTLPYPESAKKFSSLMDVKPTANQVSATITMEGKSASRIWGRVSVCLGNWMEKILSARISCLHPYSTSSRQFPTSKSPVNIYIMLTCQLHISIEQKYVKLLMIIQ